MATISLTLVTQVLVTEVRGETTLSDFNGVGFDYTFDDFTQSVGPGSLRLYDYNDGWGGAGKGVGTLDLSAMADQRFVVDFTPEPGNGVSLFDIELIDSNSNTGKWTISLGGLPAGVPATAVSPTVLGEPTHGVGDFQNLDLSQITTWQILGEFGSPAPFDLTFDRLAIEGVGPPPPYAGAEPDAPWRSVADQQIDAIRKADLTVRVVDSSGVPAPGATVSVKMQRHEFGFGSAVQAFRLRTQAAQHDAYKAKVAELFNAATLENNLKWPPWEGEWGGNFTPWGAVAALDWLGANQIEARGHVMVWPGESNLPADIKQMLADDNLSPAEQQAVRTRIADHIASLGAATAGKIGAWDVINETRTNHDLMDLMDEGNLAMVDWFGHARAEAPGADLYINDYGIITSGGGTATANQDLYYNTIEYLINEGAEIDGLGFQGHFNESSLTGPEQLWAIFDRFEQLGIKMQITEFDFTTSDEALQALYTRDILTAAFAHGGIDDFLFWGFWEDAHWRPEAALFRSDWSIKPNGQAYLDLVFDEWWTDEELQTDGQGVAGTRGFKGEYLIEASYAGQGESAVATLTGDSSEVVITLPMLVGDYNGDGRVDAADYTVWRETVGSTSQLAADGDNNGVVDQADYALWADRYGAVALSSAMPISLPEPPGGLLLAIAALGSNAAAREADVP